jgi:hypothetical protein
MDETGLSVRSMKGRKRKLVSLKSCTVPPTFHEKQDVSHVSLVARVTLGGQSLVQLILTTCDVTCKSEELMLTVYLPMDNHGRHNGPDVVAEMTR